MPATAPHPRVERDEREERAPHRAPLVVRARALAKRRVLDEHLAAGASPLTSAAHALRARQLVAPRTRRCFAAGLDRLLAEAQRPPFRPVVVAPLPRREILAARPEIRAVAVTLRADRPVYARGMALVSWLLHEGAGPAHASDAGWSLRDALRTAARALDGHPPRTG